MTEQLFVVTCRWLLDSCCRTPEERYVELMHRYPELKERRPLKEIASFIGVTPETVSAHPAETPEYPLRDYRPPQ